MILLDTDALSHLRVRDPAGLRIEVELRGAADQDVRIAVVTAFERLGGVVDLIDTRKKERRDPVLAFRLLHDLVESLAGWSELILPYDVAAERIYRGFPPRLRQELKDDARIAAIALARDAAVWTCNVGDYARVEGLAVVRADTGIRVR